MNTMYEEQNERRQHASSETLNDNPVRANSQCARCKSIGKGGIRTAKATAIAAANCVLRIMAGSERTRLALSAMKRADASRRTS